MSIFNGTLQNISAKFKHLLPAQPCTLCSTMSLDGLRCAACDQALPYLLMPHCPTCALPTPHSETCGQCLKHPPLFTHTTAVFNYTFPLDKLIQAMKYGEQLALAKPFAQLLAKQINADALPDARCHHPHAITPRQTSSARLQSIHTTRKIQREKFAVAAIKQCLPTGNRHAIAICPTVERA